MKLDICICTHNPRRDVFGRVLAALGKQTLSKAEFHVWVIDNASQPPITRTDLALLRVRDVRFTLLQEARPGQIFARATAIKASGAEWMVFVDDDTVLAPDYLEQVVEIAARNPQFGCFGGKLLLPAGIQAPEWAKPMLPYVAIKDCGDEPISKCANEWGPWEPPGGGAAVRRPLLKLYVQRLEQNAEIARLGRKGSRGLFSCDDSLLMRGAYTLGLSCSYQPQLRLEHHLARRRFKFSYLAQLLFSLGRSHVVLERALGGTVRPSPSAEGWQLWRQTRGLLSWSRWDRVRICKLAHQWGYFFESRARPGALNGSERADELNKGGAAKTRAALTAVGHLSERL